MKTLVTLFSVLLFSAGSVYAKENPGQKKTTVTKSKVAASCPNTTAQMDLAVNNVRARILNGGDLWWDPIGQTPYYEVPIGSNKTSIYSGAIWIAGMDANNQIKAAAQTYRQQGANDFWAGPIAKDNLGLLDVSTTTCAQYDRVWSLTKNEVQTFVNGGAATPDIISWPGNGNTAIGELPMLAPFFDADNDGIYNYQSGDYPYFTLSGNPPLGCNGNLKGDKTIWWVFNDIGNAHTETFSNAPIGVEIRAQAFAYSSANAAINNATFYEYQIINRSSDDLLNTYFGVWCDPDLGNAADDYVGCDVGLGLGYCYNADPDDDGAGGYGLNPPAVGIDFFQGPLADANDGIDNDKDGTTDELGETISMSKFMYYNNVNSNPTGNPSVLDDYYQYLSGIWLDGTPVTYGGTGYNSGGPACNYMFPNLSDPANPSIWSMATAAIPANDMRFLQSAGSFTLSAGEVNYITTGVVWARATSGGPTASLAELFIADSTIQSVFNNCFVTSINTNKGIAYSLYPNPCVTKSKLTFDNVKGNTCILRIYNSTGKLVKEITGIKNNNLEIDRSGLESGIYIFSISNETENLTSGKLTVL